MQGNNSVRLFGVVVFSTTGNSSPVNEDGGSGNISMTDTSSSDLITNPNTITHHCNHHQVHDTKQAFKLFGKVISQLSTHDYHDDQHDSHQDQRMNDTNIQKPSRKRERSACSSSAASTTTTTTASLPKKPKKERSPRPSKEEISKAVTTFPPLPREIQLKMAALGFDPNDEKSRPMLIFQRSVTKTDVDKQQARLQIPRGQLLKSEGEFLKDEECEQLTEGEGKINVMVIQRSMEAKDREMTLALWPKPQTRQKMKKAGKKEPSVRYSLEFGWNQVKSESSINEKDVVQVWAFRYGAKKNLGFALVNLGSIAFMQLWLLH